MEAKTMGSFLAALRKAAGMTQRELAEQLHVSDKAISRWERDECAPDLALIPVIAEIFSVSCDELLRGGRARADQAGDPAKAEKQRHWILQKTRSRYRGHTLLALLGPVLGIVAAAAAVLGFQQAVLGFWLGAVGCLVGGVVQLVLWNGVLLSLSGEQAGAEAGLCRYGLLRITEGALLFCAAVLAALLPLNWYVSWVQQLLFQNVLALPYGPVAAIAGGGTVLLGLLLGRLLNPWLARHTPVSLSPEAANKAVHHARQQSRVSLTLAAALATTVLIQGAVTLAWPVAALAHGTVYDNAENFKTMMETRTAEPEERPSAWQLTDLTRSLEAGQTVQRFNGATYSALYNQDGISYCSFQMKNQTVAFFRYQRQEGGAFPPVEVVTVDQALTALDRAKLRQQLFLALYILEAAAALVWALRRRRKIAR